MMIIALPCLCLQHVLCLQSLWKVLWGVRLNITTQTDQTINGNQQQAEMQVDYGNYTVSNPQQQIKTVVLQNRNWLDARWNSKPQYVMSNCLRWSHNQDYIFWAGNEYRKFEILSTDYTSMGVDKISWGW